MLVQKKKQSRKPSLQLKDIGEFQLIEHIQKKFKLLTKAPKGTLGIGDDCSILPLGQGRCMIFSTDMLVEGVHFLFNSMSPMDLGYKSLAVNLSDIAAMGGAPQYVFLGISMPKTLPYSWVMDFFKGFQGLAKKHGVILLGGDTTGSTEAIVISITVLGHVQEKNIKKRSMAKKGDCIYVTDSLGNSRAGLGLVLQHRNHNLRKRHHKLFKEHFRPRPHIEEGQWLSQRPEVHAMMDVSDGLASDLKQLIKASHCGARIDLDKIPTSKDLERYCHEFKKNSKAFAFIGGEDYVLLLTVNAKDQKRFEKDFFRKFGKKLKPIGVISKPSDEISLWDPFAQSFKKWTEDHQGFRHF